MEKTLQNRDRVGFEDFILLEDYTNIDAFVDNLRKRHQENLIYTSIGHVLISVNPYRTLPIYSNEYAKLYREADFLDQPPHVFGIAGLAYRSCIDENKGQCILISGESGSGKTEASKQVLQFMAAASKQGGRVETVKDKLLLSNPVLEAFGNAKTDKNDNSSRFGKYMDVAFDFEGYIVGGQILNCLLEKSRVVRQSAGERNFHIFYQLLAGADDELLDRLGLVRDTNAYSYLNQNNGSYSGNDASMFHKVTDALKKLEMEDEEMTALLCIVASILHIGNVQFVENEGIVSISDMAPVKHAAEILGCDTTALATALTHCTIEPKGDVVVKALSTDTAVCARDALAKALYDRSFSWLVNRLNSSMASSKTETVAIGILDIYGFEVFKKNGFEQFCINLCNEKLQQLFLNLTLKGEQDEYEKEGIEWVKVEFFNNKIICDLMEDNRRGIIALMNDECIRPGEPTDMTLLAKMNSAHRTHSHYFSHQRSDIQTQKTMGRDEFRIVHYAGEVTYSVNGFLEKNKDLLYRDFCQVLMKSSNCITKSVFTEENLQDKQTPKSAITEFNKSLKVLLKMLEGKEPSYIRCIRPNNSMSPALFDEDIVRHQVQYLGLMENLRVRRAGFAYRRPYGDFLERYKSLSKHTWPNYRGPEKQGVQVLVNDLGYTPDDYRMGLTKLFIRSPGTLYKTEDALQARKHELATMLQMIWRGRQQRLAYQKMRQAVISIERIVRGFLARRQMEKRKQAVETIRKFIAGFITRNGPATEINKKFLGVAKAQWLKRLATQLPKSVMDKSWPPCPAVCEEASSLLQDMHTQHLARRYCLGLSAERKRKFDLKVLAEFLFKNKKKTYKSTFSKWFEVDRISMEDREFHEEFVKTQINGERVVYCSSVSKFDRHGYKMRPRILIVSDKTVYLLDPKTKKRKHRLAINSVIGLEVSAGADDFLLVKIPEDLKKDKGDLILSVPHPIELVTTFVHLTNKPHLVRILPPGETQHNLIKSRPKPIQVTDASTPMIGKAKSGTLEVKG